MDMLSGKTPDILMIGNETPADTYVTKGIFADMYEFIDSDSELSREDFLPNLLKASETDGKLYTFSDRFKVFTVLGKTSIFGDKMGITTEQLRNIAAQRPSGTEIFPGSCKNDILDYALYMSGSRLIDIKKAHAILPPTILSGCWNMQMNICPHWIPTLILMTASGTDMPPCMPTKALCCSYPTSTIMRIYTPLSMKISASLPPPWDFPLKAV